MGVRGDAFTKPSVYHPASVVHCFNVMVTFILIQFQTMHINVLYSGSVVTAFCDEEDMLKAIYFQTSEMQRTFASYPELLLIDATYKLNDLNMPLYVLMSVDGNGESEIVCLWLTQFEDKETITELVQEFKKHNSRWSGVCRWRFCRKWFMQEMKKNTVSCMISLRTLRREFSNILRATGIAYAMSGLMV